MMAGADTRTHKWNCKCAACKKERREREERDRATQAAERERRVALIDRLLSSCATAVSPDSDPARLRVSAEAWGGKFELWTDEGVVRFDLGEYGHGASVKGTGRALFGDAAIEWVEAHARPWAEKVERDNALRASYGERVAAYRTSGAPPDWNPGHAGYQRDLALRVAAGLPLPSGEQIVAAFEDYEQRIRDLLAEAKKSETETDELTEKLAEAETKAASLEAIESSEMSEVREGMRALRELVFGPEPDEWSWEVSG